MSLRRNTALNLAGNLVPLAVSLVTLPIYLETIGEERYGVLAIAWLLLGYFSFFDLGLGRATAQRIAALRDAPAAQRTVAFTTAVAMNCGLGCLGTLIIWPAGMLVFTYGIEPEGEIGEELWDALPWLAIALPVMTVSSVLWGTLQGRERFLELNLLKVFGTAAFQVLPLGAALLWGPDLRLLMLAVLLARFITLALLFERCFRHVVQGQTVSFCKSEAVRLLRFGGWVMVTWIINPLMVALDRFVIGTVSGAATVTYYTVPFQLGERTTILSAALSSALFPRFSHASPPERSRLAEESQRILVFILTPLFALGIFAIGPFLSWWISPQFAATAAPTGAILLAGFWLNSFSIVPFGMLQAQGRPDLVAKCHLGELLPYLLVLVLAFRGFGLPGAALAFFLRCGADFALLSGLAGILRPSLHALILPSVGVVSAVPVALFLPAGGAGWWFSLAALTMCYVLLAVFTLPPSLASSWRILRRRIRPLILGTPT